MKRLTAAFATAVMLAGALVVARPVPVAAQNPTTSCQTCRVAFTTCMQKARTPTAAAACRATAQACIAACTAS
jgi:hypothetical protein